MITTKTFNPQNSLNFSLPHIISWQQWVLSNENKTHNNNISFSFKKCPYTVYRRGNHCTSSTF